MRSDLFNFQPAHSEALTRLCGLQGPSPGWLTREIQPGITLANLEDPQYLWLARTGQFSCGQGTPNNAARNSCVMLSPASAQTAKIARVRQLIISTAAGVPLSISISVIAVGTILPAILNTVSVLGGVRDGRQVAAQGVAHFIPGLESKLKHFFGEVVSGQTGDSDQSDLERQRRRGSWPTSRGNRRRGSLLQCSLSLAGELRLDLVQRLVFRWLLRAIARRITGAILAGRLLFPATEQRRPDGRGQPFRRCPFRRRGFLGVETARLRCYKSPIVRIIG